MGVTQPPASQQKKGLAARWRLPARGVLGLLSFLGFFTNYMLRVNINIAIVEMVLAPASPPPAEPGGGAAPDSCAPPPTAAAAGNLSAAAEVTGEFPWSVRDQGLVLGSYYWCYMLTLLLVTGEFPWSVRDQGLVLGSYYWCYVLTLLPADLIAQRLGTKVVFGTANLLSSLGALLTPLATRHHYAALIAVRVLQGVSSGPTWPAMHVMVSRWIPPHERSKFVSTYYGNSVGAAAAFPLCGVLIAHLGWEYAFYVPGMVGITWCCLWWLLVFDSPAEHPRISRKEREMIEREVRPYLAKKQPPVPLWEILTCAPFWALIAGNLAGTWSFLFFLTYGPTYLKSLHGLGVGMNGLVSGLPNLSRFAVAVSFSCVADHLLGSRGWSVTRVRKLATAAALLPPAALCLVLTHTGCSAPAEILLLVVMTGLGGCASSGTLANSLDLGPNFAGVTLGMVSFVSVSSGFLIPAMVSGIIGDQLTSMAKWRVVFGVVSGICLSSCLVFLAFGSGEVQSWNRPRPPPAAPAEDLLLEERPQGA